MSVLLDLGSVLVIGAKKDAAVIPWGDGFGKLHASCIRANTEMGVNAFGNLLFHFLDSDGFVVGHDTTAKIGIELVALQERSVAIDDFIGFMGGFEFLNSVWIASDDGRIGHEFTKAVDVFIGDIVGDVVSVKDGTASFEWGGWDAARELDFDVERDVFGGFDDIMDAVHAKDVRELMRIGDDGCCAMWDDHRGEFLWGAL